MLQLPNIDDLREMLDFEPVYFILMFDDKRSTEESGYLIHIAIYPCEPSSNDINGLYEELQTDEEFGLMHLDFEHDVSYICMNHFEYERLYNGVMGEEQE